MPNFMRGIFALILTIIGLILYPSLRGADLSDNMAERIANDAVIKFVDTVRGKGYVDVRDYDVFKKTIDYSGIAYNIEMEYYKWETQPVYTDPKNPATFANTFSVNYEGYFNKDILNLLYPGQGSTLPSDDPARRFKMHAGDLFNVRLVSQQATLGSRLRRVIFHLSLVPSVIPYGGMVRNEAP